MVVMVVELKELFSVELLMDDLYLFDVQVLLVMEVLIEKLLFLVQDA
jgi:hypothetical protein